MDTNLAVDGADDGDRPRDDAPAEELISLYLNTPRQRLS